MDEDSRDDPFRNPAHGPARPPGALEAERVDFRVTYEEQCANDRQHYHFKTRARNTPLEELITSQPIEDCCPRCDGPIIGLPNRSVIE